MKLFVKTVLISGLGIGCLSLGSGAQQPPPPPVAPAPPATAGGVTVMQPVPGVPATLNGAGFMRFGDRVWTVTYKEDGKAAELARKMVDAKDREEQEKLRKQLREVLDKGFDERQKRHEKEIEALEAQVKKLREMVAKRKENRDEIIDERMKQLERDASGLGW